MMLQATTARDFELVIGPLRRGCSGGFNTWLGGDSFKGPEEPSYNSYYGNHRPQLVVPPATMEHRINVAQRADFW